MYKYLVFILIIFFIYLINCNLKKNSNNSYLKEYLNNANLGNNMIYNTDSLINQKFNIFKNYITENEFSGYKLTFKNAINTYSFVDNHLFRLTHDDNLESIYNIFKNILLNLNDENLNENSLLSELYIVDSAPIDILEKYKNDNLNNMRLSRNEKNKINNLNHQEYEVLINNKVNDYINNYNALFGIIGKNIKLNNDNSKIVQYTTVNLDILKLNIKKNKNEIINFINQNHDFFEDNINDYPSLNYDKSISDNNFYDVIIKLETNDDIIFGYKLKSDEGEIFNEWSLNNINYQDKGLEDIIPIWMKLRLPNNRNSDSKKLHYNICQILSSIGNVKFNNKNKRKRLDNGKTIYVLKQLMSPMTYKKLKLKHLRYLLDQNNNLFNYNWNLNDISDEERQIIENIIYDVVFSWQGVILSNELLPSGLKLKNDSIFSSNRYIQNSDNINNLDVILINKYYFNDKTGLLFKYYNDIKNVESLNISEIGYNLLNVFYKLEVENLDYEYLYTCYIFNDLIHFNNVLGLDNNLYYDNSGNYKNINNFNYIYFKDKDGKSSIDISNGTLNINNEFNNGNKLNSFETEFQIIHYDNNLTNNNEKLVGHYIENENPIWDELINLNLSENELLKLINNIDDDTLDKFEINQKDIYDKIYKHFYKFSEVSLNIFNTKYHVGNNIKKMKSNDGIFLFKKINNKYYYLKSISENTIHMEILDGINVNRLILDYINSKKIIQIPFLKKLYLESIQKENNLLIQLIKILDSVIILYFLHHNRNISDIPINLFDKYKQKNLDRFDRKLNYDFVNKIKINFFNGDMYFIGDGDNLKNTKEFSKINDYFISCIINNFEKSEPKINRVKQLFVKENDKYILYEFNDYVYYIGNILNINYFSYDNFIKQKKIYINNMLNLEKYYKDDTQEIANLNGLILNLNKSWNKYWNNLDSKKFFEIKKFNGNSTDILDANTMNDYSITKKSDDPIIILELNKSIIFYKTVDSDIDTGLIDKVTMTLNNRSVNSYGNYDNININTNYTVFKDTNLNEIEVIRFNENNNGINLDNYNKNFNDFNFISHDFALLYYIIKNDKMLTNDEKVDAIYTCLAYNKIIYKIFLGSLTTKLLNQISMEYESRDKIEFVIPYCINVIKEKIPNINIEEQHILDYIYSINYKLAIRINPNDNSLLSTDEFKQISLSIFKKKWLSNTIISFCNTLRLNNKFNIGDNNILDNDMITRLFNIIFNKTSIPNYLSSDDNLTNFIFYTFHFYNIIISKYGNLRNFLNIKFSLELDENNELNQQIDREIIKMSNNESNIINSIRKLYNIVKRYNNVFYEYLYFEENNEKYYYLNKLTIDLKVIEKLNQNDIMNCYDYINIDDFFSSKYSFNKLDNYLINLKNNALSNIRDSKEKETYNFIRRNFNKNHLDMHLRKIDSLLLDTNLSINDINIQLIDEIKYLKIKDIYFELNKLEDIYYFDCFNKELTNSCNIVYTLDYKLLSSSDDDSLYNSMENIITFLEFKKFSKLTRNEIEINYPNNSDNEYIYINACNNESCDDMNCNDIYLDSFNHCSKEQNLNDFYDILSKPISEFKNFTNDFIDELKVILNNINVIGNITKDTNFKSIREIFDRYEIRENIKNLNEPFANIENINDESFNIISPYDRNNFFYI